uniref:cell surface A33 antigen-like n=1 Tax=Pristiophorus japonicus TaxID=55135 RepID=UPI00398E38F3
MLAEVVLALFSVLTAVNAMRVNIPQNQIEIARGDDLKLTCQYTSTTSDKTGFNVEWRRLPEDIKEKRVDVIQYFFGGIYKVGKLYTGRVNFTGDTEKDDCSIMIKKTHMSDSGTYRIKVESPFDFEGQNDGRIIVTILVAPSTPVCAIKGKAEFGETVNVTCHSEEGSPKPVYSWQSFNGQNVQRQLPPTSVQAPGVLTLKNISADNSGFFICTSKNKIRAATCNITLAVMPPSMNIAFYAGIIGAGIGGLIILGIIVYCCCCRGNGKTPEDYEMEDPQYRREGEEEEDEEELPGRDSEKRDYRGAYYDEVPHENDGEYARNSTAKAPLAPPNKPKNVPENYDV